MTTVPTMPEEPTLADIARHVMALHDCVHDGQEKNAARAEEVAKELREHRHESRNNAQKVQAQIGSIDSRLSNTEGQLRIIGRTVGAPSSNQSAGNAALKFMNLKWWHALLGLGAALAAGTGGYKIVASALTSFHHAMMGG